MSETEIQEIKLRLYDNPILRAGQLYKILIRQPVEVRKDLQAMIERVPLTKEPEGNYVSSDGSD